MSKNHRFETRQIHVGQESPDPATDARAVPIYATTSYVFKDSEQAAGRFALAEPGNIYNRLMNPTADVFEKRIASLEGGAAALAVSTGAAAVTYAIQNIARAGDHIVSSSTVYGGTYNLFANTLADAGIETTFVDARDVQNFSRAIRNNTKALYVESLGNPNCDIVDMEALAEVAHAHGIPLIVDSTFATPFLFRPLEHGADIVVHSATKFIGGHGTVMGGLVIDSGKFPWKGNARFPEMNAPDPSYHGLVFSEVFGAAAFITKLRVCTMRDLGFAPSPFNSFMLIQGIETLALRMEKLSASARRVAEYLDASPYVEKVRSPYIASNEYHALATRLMPNGYGGMLSFDIKGGRAAGGRFIDALKLISNVANLGDARTIVIHPASTTHSQLDDKQLAAAGISGGTIRLSLGLENVEDVLADIAHALEAAQNA